MRIRMSTVAVTAIAALLGLTGCQATDQEIEVANAWAKSAPSGMTGVFAEITNPRDEPITLVGGSTEAASMVELHEVVGGVMQEKQGGMLIEPGATLTLEPGGDHIMLMGLTDPLEAGETVIVTIALDSGETLELEAAVRDYAGANEEYVGGGEMNHGGME